MVGTACSYLSYLAIRRHISQNSFTERNLKETWLKSIPFVASSSDEVPRLLRVRRLSVSYASGSSSPVMALRQLDLEIAKGEVVGILGESGCGKSTLALSMLGLLPAHAKVEGSMLFRNEELLGLPEKQLRRIRGARIALIHQEPGLALRSPYKARFWAYCETSIKHLVRPSCSSLTIQPCLPDLPTA